MKKLRTRRQPLHSVRSSARISLQLCWIRWSNTSSTVLCGNLLVTRRPVSRSVTDSIVSLLYVMEDGSSAEIAIVGFEGIGHAAVLFLGALVYARACAQL